MSATHQQYSLPESSDKDVAGKFRIFRLGVESTERKLKDANAVIERLKEEINFSRDSEKNLRDQLASAQNRLSKSEQAFTKVAIAHEQQQQIEKISQRMEQTIEKISHEIKTTREKYQSVLQHVSREADLEKETKNLRSLLEKKIRENDRINMEVLTLATEKKNMEIANEQKFRNLESQLEKLKRRQLDAEASYRETQKYYEQQLEEKDQTIKLYEKERKGFLDDFEPSRVSKVDSDDIKPADRTIAIQILKRDQKAASFEGPTSQIKPKESNAKVLPCSQSDERLNKPSSRKRGDHNLPKMSRKQKPQLEFLAPSQSSSQGTISVKKRRLFSGDYNYYTEEI